MYIKKFKNGKIKFKLEKQYDLIDGELLYDMIYDRDLTMKDLYFEQIEGENYMVDYNTGFVYYMGSYLMQNPLKEFVDSVAETGKYYIYPLSRRESKSLLKELQNEEEY